jgi:hypothetical protein
VPIPDDKYIGAWSSKLCALFRAAAFAARAVPRVYPKRPSSYRTWFSFYAILVKVYNQDDIDSKSWMHRRNKNQSYQSN